MMNDTKSAIALFIIPLFYLLICVLYISSMGSYSLVTIDPEFNYLFNGILLAHLKFHLNAVGHPGTPIQLLIAIVSRVVHLFRPGMSLWDDVILNPDIYIRSTVYTAAVINTVMLAVLGKTVFRKSSNLIASVVLQLTPFAFLLTLEESNRMMPELIMPSIVALWIIMLTGLLFNSPKDISYKKFALKFGILMGFSLADKLTFIPFIVIPLLILPGIKIKLRYLFFTAVAFCLFAIPVLFNFNKFVNWVFNLFMHKGVYGGGERGILDWNLFCEHMQLMVQQTYQLLIPAFLLLLYSLIRLAGSRNNTTSRIALGISSAVVIQFIITAKHFAFYYLTPVLLLTLFNGFLICEILKTKTGIKWLSNSLLLAFGLFLFTLTALKIGDQLNGLKERKHIREIAFLKFEPLLKNKLKIIAPDYFNCSSPEYALSFGLLESGRYAKNVQTIMEKHYPETYMYYSWSGDCYKNTRIVNAESILKPGVEYVLLVCNDSDEKLRQIADKLKGEDEKDILQIKRIAESKATRETLYIIKKALP
jgi:hypothetical protein